MKKVFLLLAIIAILISCKKNDNDPIPDVDADVISAAGSAAEIAGAVGQFRTLIGEPLNVAPGATGGRREINWDGVPPNFTNNNNFPLDFFNITDPAGPNGRKRGMVFLNTGTPIRIDSTNFAEIDAGYANDFLPFSQNRLIIAANSVKSEIAFKVPGTNTDAFVKGFGIVFSDVDDANSTTLQFYAGYKNLGSFKAPAKAGNQNFSFLGVHFPQEKVTRVVITSGNGTLAAGTNDVTDGGSKDLVVFDDFFYNEPVAQ